MTEIQRIQDQMARAFDGAAWHGTPLMGLLQGLSATRAAARPVPEAHTIWEIVLHIMAWRDVACRRLAGETVVELPDEDDWPAVGEVSDAAWRRTMDTLSRSQQRLLAAVGAFPESRLNERVQGMSYSFYVLLHGVVQHDLYHAGQIALLKKGPRF